MTVNQYTMYFSLSLNMPCTTSLFHYIRWNWWMKTNRKI
jgi:hypothetical protein